MYAKTYALTALPPQLSQQIHQARASQFVDRLGWKLTVKDDGGETDQFDDENAYYIVVSEAERHVLSCRIRPAVVGTMIEECFAEIFPDAMKFLDFQRSVLWEVTRFCRCPSISISQSAEALRIMSFELDSFRDTFGATGFVAVVYPQFPRFLSRLGARYLRLSEGMIDNQRSQLICVTQSVAYRPSSQEATINLHACNSSRIPSLPNSSLGFRRAMSESGVRAV